VPPVRAGAVSGLARHRFVFFKRAVSRSNRWRILPPWTPKFYGEFLKAIGVTILTVTAERKDNLSNKSQAYHFMRLVEEAELLRADKG
jgi:hypothetical protein